MIEEELRDIGPLIEISNMWKEGLDPATPIWIENDCGKQRVQTEQPVSVFAKVLRVDTLGLAEEPTVPTIAIEWPSGRNRLYLPDSYENDAPYEGRQWSWAKHHCFSLVSDYYYREQGYDMRHINESATRIRSTNTMDAQFEMHEEVANWERVIEPQAGDGVYFSIRGIETPQHANLPNHVGIFLGDNMLLHHFMGRLSCIEEFSAQWRKYVVAYMRRKP